MLAAAGHEEINVGTLGRAKIVIKRANGHSYFAVEQAIRLIASGEYPLHELCTHSYGLEDSDRLGGGRGRNIMPERVWDRFLTEQDRSHLAMSGHRRIGFGRRPALLLIDLYRWVFGDRPEPLLEAIKTWPGSCGLAAWQAIPPIQTLLKAARDTSIPIVHLTGLDHSGMEGWTAWREPPQGPELSPEARDRRKRRWDIIEEVSPLPGEAVLRKSSPSAFWGTPLAGHLNYLGVDTIITCGESTSGCVRASVVDGCTYRYRMIVVEECVFDRHEAAHAINLFDMNQKYADVLPLADVLDYLAKWRAERDREQPS